MVLKLLKLEYSKFRKNSVITLLALFFIFFLPLSLYFGEFFKTLQQSVNMPLKINILSAPLIWDYLGYAGNWVVFFFLGVMVIYTVTIDATTKTMRQNIITGLSRKEYYLAKFFTVNVLAIAATLYYFILALAFGWLNTKNVSLGSLMDNEMAIPRFWLMSFAYLNFALLLAFYFRKPGIAVFVYLTYMIVGEPIIKLLIKKYIMENKFVNYLPMNVAEDLMPFPVIKMAEGFGRKEVEEMLLPYGEAALMTVIWTSIIIVTTYYIFNKRDI